MQTQVMRSAEIEEKLMRAERRNIELGKSHAVRLLLFHHSIEYYRRPKQSHSLQI